MFWAAIRPLLEHDTQALEKLDSIRQGFADAMQNQIQKMWASKLGLPEFMPELFSTLMQLMLRTKVDYTIFFRELSHIPTDISALKKSFYRESSPALDEQWQAWLNSWRNQIAGGDLSGLSQKMKRVNPKYAWREWLIVPAYEQAAQGDYSLVNELQEVLNAPYDEQSKEVEEKYYRPRPEAFFHAGGVSHYSCSS